MSKKKKGFTLVELIVVIGILLVLAVLATVGYGNLSDTARRAALRADAVTLTRALNVFNSVSTSVKVNGDDANAAMGVLVAIEKSSDGVVNGTFNLSVHPDGAESTSTNTPGDPGEGIPDTTTSHPAPYKGVADLPSSISVELESLEILCQAYTDSTLPDEGGWVYWDGQKWTVRQGGLTLGTGNTPKFVEEEEEEEL
jgi:prepilin-type N-terminal cleavage/methylation domain-containing protein